MKQITVEKVIKPTCSSFCAVNYENAYFTAPMHIHPEYELILIEKGSGHAFIGDMVYQMAPGNFMLIGSNLPHLWLSEDKYYESGTTLRSASVYAQFPAEIFPPVKTHPNEFTPIWNLLRESQKGLVFSGKALPELRELFRCLPEMEGFGRLMELYRLLHELAHCPFVHLASEEYACPSDMSDSIIQRANLYLNQHYQEDVTLEQVAGHVGMNPSALCRYYKRHTGKKLFEYLVGLRISYATKLLAYRHKSIGEIAYDCGYNNISNFNRQFKRIVGKTPSEYENHLCHTPQAKSL